MSVKPRTAATFVRSAAAAGAPRWRRHGLGSAAPRCSRRRPQPPQVQARLCAALRDVPAARGRGSVAQLEFMARRRLHGARGQRHARPARRRAGAHRPDAARLNMRMGVFVAHTINWNEPTLTTGDAGDRDTFLKEVRESVDVAKRVNAKWMTVVPGHVDRRPTWTTRRRTSSRR